MAKTKKRQRMGAAIQVRMTPEQSDQVERYASGRSIGFSEAVRELLARGFDPIDEDYVDEPPCVASPLASKLGDSGTVACALLSVSPQHVKHFAERWGWSAKDHKAILAEVRAGSLLGVTTEELAELEEDDGIVVVRS